MQVELTAGQLLIIRVALRAEVDAITKEIVDRVGRKEHTSAENMHEKLCEVKATLEAVRSPLMQATEGRLNG